jgi:hypothetical protein
MWQWKSKCRPGNPSPSEADYFRGDALADCTAARPGVRYHQGYEISASSARPTWPLWVVPGRSAAGSRMAEKRRRLPLAIPMHERLLVAVAHSRAAVPVSASNCHSAVWLEYQRRVGSGIPDQETVGRPTDTQIPIGYGRTRDLPAPFTADGLPRKTSPPYPAA